MKSPAAGFTLIELVVATAILALVGAMAYTGLADSLPRHEASKAYAARNREMQRGWFLISRDFALASARPVRESVLGSTEAALLADGQSDTAIRLTQASRTNPGNRTRSNQQRVGYLVDNGELKRLAWPVLDQAQDSVPIETTLITRVTSLGLRFMDEQNQWHVQWPPANIPVTYPEAYMPLAIDITLDLEDWGTVNRIIEIAAINQ